MKRWVCRADTSAELGLTGLLVALTGEKGEGRKRSRGASVSSQRSSQDAAEGHGAQDLRSGGLCRRQDSAVLLWETWRLWGGGRQGPTHAVSRAKGTVSGRVAAQAGGRRGALGLPGPEEREPWGGKEPRGGKEPQVRWADGLAFCWVTEMAGRVCSREKSL